MNILIIGSKGFIGTHAINYFQASESFQVWGADVVVDYVSENYFLIESTASDFKEVFQQAEFDYCINCSGAASVPDSLTNPLRDYQLNTANVFKILEAIRLHSPKCKFLNLSSAAVYGNPTALPVSESALEAPLSPYGYHKLAADQICKEYYQLFKIPTCSLRIFSVYGEGLKKQLFWDLYHKAAGKKVLELFGTGKESRDFIHVSDLLRAIQAVMDSSAFEGSIINIGNGAEVLIEDAVSILLSKMNWKGDATFSGVERAGDPNNWQADITLLKEYGYQQGMTMEQGLTKYVTWVSELE